MSEPIPYWEEIKRKLIHLSSLWMVCSTILLPRLFPAYGRWINCGLLLFCLVSTLLIEHDYANNGKYIGRLYGKLFQKMLRREAKPGQWIVSGGAPVLAAALLVNLIFPSPIAAAALAVMLTGDAAAALIGRKFGKHKLVNGKSLEGTLAFILTGIAVSGIFISATGAVSLLPYTLPAVILAALTELFQKQLKVDDNFSIPLATAGFLQLMLWLH